MARELVQLFFSFDVREVPGEEILLGHAAVRSDEHIAAKLQAQASMS